MTNQMSDDEKSMRAIDMFESAWFGQGDAFWAWVKTDAALPYMLAFREMRTPLDTTQPLDFLSESDEPDLLDPDHLEALSASIEEQYGEKAPQND